MPKKGERGDGFMGVKALADRFKGEMPKPNRPNNYKGKLVSMPDAYEEGKYVPWARGQKIGSVKEVVFDAEGRKYVPNTAVCVVPCFFLCWDLKTVFPCEQRISGRLPETQDGACHRGKEDHRGQGRGGAEVGEPRS